MADVVGAGFLVIATGICLIAFFNVLNALFPLRCERTRHSAESAPVRTFFLGLVNFLFFGALILGFYALGEGVHQIFFIPAILIAILFCIGIIFGLGGVVLLTGTRLFPDKMPLQRIGWGTAALYLASLTPFIGWFGITVYIGLMGLGAFILSFFQVASSKIES